MKQPKISIIVPIYNVEKYLDECMQSLLNQTLKDIEIILVDDESPDNCPKMCDDFANKDTRVKVVHKKNGGLGFARNSGLDVATGEYVAFIDSDDFIDLNMMETLYHVAISEKADVVRCGLKFYSDNSFKERHDVITKQVFRGRNQVDDFLLDFVGPKPECKRDVKYMVSACCCIHSRKLIEEYKLRFMSERLTLSEDLIWAIDLYTKAQCIVYLPYCFYAYRMNPTSITHNYNMDKYNRNHKFYALIETKLSYCFPREKYVNNILRSKFHYIRIAISNFARQEHALDKLKIVLNDQLWDDLFALYPFMKLPFKPRLYFLCLKLKSPMLMKVVHKIINI